MATHQNSSYLNTFFSIQNAQFVTTVKKKFTTKNHSPQMTFNVGTTVYIQMEKEGESTFAFIVAYKESEEEESEIQELINSPINLSSSGPDYDPFDPPEPNEEYYNGDDMPLLFKYDKIKPYVPNILRF